jgi:uncharacterized protein
MEKYERFLEKNLQNWLDSGKILLIYGARQVGKTTISKNLVENHNNAIYLNCERMVVKEALESKNLDSILELMNGSRLVILDEAQKINDIGSVLKLIIDNHPEIQLIATGSSSFDLHNQVNEAVTGRNIKFRMLPLSVKELLINHDKISLKERLETMLRFGMYPDVVDRPESQKKDLLDSLATDYLYRDVLEFQNVKKSYLLMNLLKALALQLGSEVSNRELAQLLNTSVETVQKYLILLEQSFVIFRIGSFSRNLRKELGNSQKYYFYDMGIRNSLIQNYNTLVNRTDKGALWENFMIVERMKYLDASSKKVNHYFWRTYDQKEIDLIEESDGELRCFEFKYKERKKTKIPKEFLETYSNSTFLEINTENYWNFIGMN